MVNSSGIDEGVIKFRCNWERCENYSDLSLLDEMILWRQFLYKANLIGAYPGAIGFGNLSIRLDHSRFIISGSGTGTIEEIGYHHFTLVESFDLLSNEVNCKGPIKASSESLTHGLIYQLDPNIKAVVHGHHAKTWRYLIDNKLVPLTATHIPYGTPEMAQAVQQLYRDSSLPERKIFATKGHEDGIFSFDNQLEKAALALMNLCQ